jgi:L-rhamnose 1-dehydrogenase
MGGGEQAHYTPTKAGVKSLMESCAIALGPMGIRCNSVLPGESPLAGSLRRALPSCIEPVISSRLYHLSCLVRTSPSVAPADTVGTIETNINKEDLSNESKRADQIRRVPLGRLGMPEDLAGPVLFFASDQSSYVNGASLLVDGGMAISLQ